MKVIKINLHNINKEHIISPIKSALADGKLLVYATDTLYGLGADPFNAEGVEKLKRTKGRAAEQKLSIAVPDVDYLLKLTKKESRIEDACRNLLPGPITLIVPAGITAPEPVVTGDNKIGVRIPDNPLTLALLNQTGPLTATSANLHGGPDPEDIKTAEDQLGENVELYLDSGPCRFKSQSTILDLTHDVPKILREGVITRFEIEKKLDTRVD